MKKLFVLLSGVVLILVMQAGAFAEEKAELKKPTITSAKPEWAATCSPKEDKYSKYPESEEEKRYKEYMRQLGQQAEAERNK